MQFVSALDRVSGMRGVLCLFEGVCAGAADGYARMTGRPAATLLHLGPGLANGLSNFHNARKGCSPVVSIVGQHSTSHLSHDAPLTSDIAGIARTVSGFVRTVSCVEDVGPDAAATVQAARIAPGQVATLIVPADFSWSESGPVGEVAPVPPRAAPDTTRIRQIAAILRSAEPAAFLLGGRTLVAPAFHPAMQMATATGVRVLGNRYGARYGRGGGIPAPQRLPYFPEGAEAVLAGLKHLILVESPPPISFFGYPGRRSILTAEDCSTHTLAGVEEDGVAALQALAEECGAASIKVSVASPILPEWPEPGPLTLDAIGRILAHLLPAGAILSDETVSSGEPVFRHLAAAAAHDQLPVTGGSIGQGLPVAVGAAVACPGRKVVSLEADGSGLYTPQSLWTMARERLDVVTVVLANRRYKILDIEMERTGAGKAGPRADDMFALSRPDIDWVKIAEGLGVEAASAATVEAFDKQFRKAVGRPGPFLIEAVLKS